ncbi:integral membrane protein [Colletotrichum sojae]|uniref:Integral membrane protein n=1 Tax=Colletotrichum sojae TaxID=2175907 RepID=A0A8H6ISJ0_9PEZI|nr:integral membrane protein [Colletotrichum sojae]
MARGFPTGKVPTFTFLPILSSMITAKLGGSQLLQDISKVSGSDLVGQDVKPITLRIPFTYYITLLGACGHGNGDTVCTPRRVGYFFDPRADLRLDATTAAASFSPSLDDTIATYAKTSSFLGVAYIFAFALTVLAPVASCASARFGRPGLAGTVMSCIATFCLLAASIAAVVIFKKVETTFNDDIGGIGVSCELGLLVVPSWIAFGFSLLASVLLNFKTRKTGPGRGGLGKGPTSGMITGDRTVVNVNVNNGPRPLTLLKRVRTWGQYKYTQIGTPAAAKRGRGGGGEFDDDRALIWRAESPELESKSVHESSGIAMVPLDHRGNQDMNMAYEPFTGRAV